ncbi:MAG: PEP-CTERM sorting domain-containing protein [Verrucomicrobiota bacterium]
MKYTLAGICLLVGGAFSLKAATVSGLGDLISVVGSGSNFAGLVIDFNDGLSTESFAWGYRWDGAASGEDMLVAILSADPNLSIDSTSFIQEISYFDGVDLHVQASDFGVGALSWGYYVAGGFSGDDQSTMPGGNPIAVGGGGTSLPSSWTIANSGPSGLDFFGDPGRVLEDGSWDAWSFGSYDPNTFAHLVAPGPELPTAAVIVPEPSGVLLSAFALVGGLLRRRR